MKKSNNRTSHTVKFIGSGWRLWAHNLLLIINFSEKEKKEKVVPPSQ